MCKAFEEKKMGDEYLSRLKRELSVILAKNIQDYFMTVSQDRRHREEHWLLIGPGRGSAVGSLVSYLLEITRIDPTGRPVL